MPRYVITGGLGTGKTSVLSALDPVLETVAEPARELIAEHRAATGEATLDHDPALFVERLIERSIEKYWSVSDGAMAVFDRGLPDCVAYAAVSGLDTSRAFEIAAEHRYDSPVFVAPPWREIYATDDMRKATLSQAEAFHEEVVTTYDRLGYEMVELPKMPVADRVDFVEDRLL